MTRRKSARAFRGVYLAILMAFMYLPILMMVALSFNDSVSRANWGGFTLDWYKKLLDDPAVIESVKVTFSVAVLASLISAVIGTAAAIGIHSMKKGWSMAMVNLSYLPMTTPDIVTGVSLMLMFVFAKIPLGYCTMLMSHIAFCIPYVLFSVQPRLRMMNPNMYEAALDLGCKPWQAILKVIVPEVEQGIAAGTLLAFTMSIDDFVISYFTSNTAQNLSMLVYSAARRGIEPTMYALSTLMFLTVLVLLLVVNRKAHLID